MKLNFVADIRLPTQKAHGIQIMKMCEAFSDCDSEVTLYIPSRKNKINEDPFEYYGVKRNFKIIKLPSLDLIHLGVFEKLMFYVHSFSFAVSVFFNLILKDGEIYSRDILPIFPLSIFKKVTWESHVASWNIFVSVFSKANKVVVISKGIYDDYIKRGVREENILIAEDGADREDFAHLDTKNNLRLELGFEDNIKYVLYAGKMDKWKGYDTLLRASKILPDNIKVVMLGFSEEVSIDDLKKQFSNVIFKGHVNYKMVPQYLKAADLLVIPNSAKSLVSNLYTSPLKVYMSMFSNTPILASNIPSLRATLNDNNAFFFEADNENSLADTIGGVFANYDLAIEKANEAYINVGDYSWINRAKKILTWIK